MSPMDPADTDLLYPLSAFMCDASGGVFSAEILEAHELPQPYRALLAHDRDMTGTLEVYFDQAMELRVHVKRVEGDSLYRQVTLYGRDDGQPKEFGAIHIDLGCFDGPTRDLVVACGVPLGRVLREHGVAYVSNPSAFLRVKPDEGIQRALNTSESLLYGRKNELTTPDNRAIAQIIEILPPLAANRLETNKESL